MGYVTYFNGEIQFSNKSAYDFAKLCFSNETEHCYSLYDSSFDDENINIGICEDWKDYHDEMVSICLMALDLDKDVIISIDCSGEENDDNWLIETVDKKLVVNRGRIVYDEVEEVSENLKTQKYLQRLYDITKDEKILKEMVLNKMESE